MNLLELANKLRQLSDPDFKEFVRNFGGDYQDRDGVVRDLVDDPNWNGVSANCFTSPQRKRRWCRRKWKQPQVQNGPHL